jgi:hypothetical protein
MERNERPYILSIAAALFLINGVMAFVAMFTDRGIDLLALGSLLVVFGILARKGWTLIMLQILAGLHIVAAVFVSLSFVLPFNGTGKAQISFHQMQWEVSPVLMKFIFIVVVAFYAFAAFSKGTKDYFART